MKFNELFENKDKVNEEESSSFNLFLNSFINEIKNGSIKEIHYGDGLSKEEFLIKDKEGNNLIDYIFKYNLVLDDALERYIYSDDNIIKYLFDKKYINEELMGKIVNPNIIKICNLNLKFNLIKYINPEALLLRNDYGYVIEELFKDKNENLKYLITKLPMDKSQIVKQLCNKYNKNDYYDLYVEELSFNKANKPLIFEELITSNKLTSSFINKVLNNHTEAVDILKKYNRLDLLCHASLDYLLKPYKSYTILEYLIDNNLFNDKIIINNKKDNKETIDKLAEILVKKKLYDSLIHIPRKLLDKYNNEYYIDIYLKNRNKDKKVNTLKNKFYNFNNEELAFIYHKCNKYKQLDLLLPLTDDKLLELRNGNRLIDSLLYYKDEIKDLIPYSTRKKPSIKAILNMHGIEDDEKIIVVDDSNFGHVKRDEYLNLKIDKITQMRIDRLKILFSDGLSNEEAVKTMIASFTYLASINYEYLDEELDLLTDYKIQNPRFKLTKTKQRAIFDNDNKLINLNNSTVEIFNHEIGHAFHSMSCDYEIPKEFHEEIDKLLKDPEFEDRLLEFVDALKKERDLNTKESQEIYDKKFRNSFTFKKMNELKRIADAEKKELKNELLNLGYEEKTINSIINNIYKVSHKRYLEEYEKIKVREILSYLMIENDIALVSIADILDSILAGKMYEDGYKTRSGKIVKVGIGHGKEYYESERNRFTEIIANYSSLIKDEQRERYIETLRYMIGDSFVELINNFYENKIVKHTQEIKHL